MRSEAFALRTISEYASQRLSDRESSSSRYRQLDTSGDGAVTYEDLEMFTEHMKKPKKRGI